MATKEKMEALIINGTSYKTTLTESFKNRKNWVKPDEKMVEAYIPGKILEIFVKEGQKVKPGAKLLILEAMKMRNIVTAPVAGVIKKIHTKVGNQVPKRTLLIEIE